MTNADQTTGRPNVVVCGCVHYDVIPDATRRQVLGGLSEAGLDVQVVDDLCGLAARRDPALGRWVHAGLLNIVACYPRTVRWLLHAAGVSPVPGGIEVYNMRTDRPEEIVSRVLGRAVSPPLPGQPLPPRPSGWIPWFPVIDYDRCRGCRQCLNFCLFGVYALSKDSRVEVIHPAQCKTNCPACARACPHRAIIFPKYADPPINGAEVSDGPGQGQDASGDLGRVLAGDVRDLLRHRGSPAIDAVRRDLDIPPEVLAALSPADLERIDQETRSHPREEGQADGV